MQPPDAPEGFQRFIGWARRERVAGRGFCYAIHPADGRDEAIGLIRGRLPWRPATASRSGLLHRRLTLGHRHLRRSCAARELPVPSRRRQASGSASSSRIFALEGALASLARTRKACYAKRWTSAAIVSIRPSGRSNAASGCLVCWSRSASSNSVRGMRVRRCRRARSSAPRVDVPAASVCRSPGARCASSFSVTHRRSST